MISTHTITHNRNRRTVSAFHAVAVFTMLAFFGPADTEAGKRTETVPPDVMRRIHMTVRTPFKYGVVLKGENGVAVDSPSVFRHRGTWYMLYITFEGSGYETRIASSPDLLHWSTLGTVLARGSGGWDDRQVAGYAALQDFRWGGSYGLERYDGRYWLTFLGGALDGYETDPLATGVAWTDDPASPREWTRNPGNPVLHRDQPGVRAFEKVTLYKSTVIHDRAQTLGAPFLMFYNGKTAEKGASVERIGMAVSDDMLSWRRYGDGPVIDNGSGISGDPQIARIGDVWVMFYFGAFWRPKAFDTFACSYDLIHWTKWTGPDLIEPSEPWDATYAHKPWVVVWKGTVYHFYCAVGDQGRVIALATSKDLRTAARKDRAR